MALDKIGNLIEVDDWVVYARSKGDSIHFGHVTNVVGDSVRVRCDDTGRVSVNARHGSEILVISMLKESHPELFI